MSGRTRSDDDSPRASAGPRAPGGGSGPAGAPELELALVRYDDRPDRCTVHPPDATGLDRMSTWLSVDRSLVIDAESMR